MHIEIMANFHSDIPDTRYAIHLEVCSKISDRLNHDKTIAKKNQPIIYD